MSKIVKLQIKNVMRLSFVEIVPPGGGGPVRITGKNDQGKSSILESIKMLLGGKEMIPPEPIKRGAERGEIIAQTDDGLVFKRWFTAQDQSYFEVLTKDGAAYKTPQAIVDRMIGSPLVFDPLAFTRMKPDKQSAVLRDLAKLDTTIIDARITAVFEERTAVNAALKEANINAKAAHGTYPESTPATPVPINDLTDQIVNAEAYRHATREMVRGRDTVSQTLATHVKLRGDVAAQIKTMELQLAEKRKLLTSTTNDISTLNAKLDRCAKAVADRVDPDVSDITAKAAEIQAVNANVAKRLDYEKRLARVNDLAAKALNLSGTLDQYRAQRADMIAKAPMPVKGLQLEDGLVRFEDTPFQQLSSSKQIRISTAIAMAIQPAEGLRIAFIHDGSLLDDESKQAIFAEIGDKAQLWIEETTNGDEPVGFVIEDGTNKTFAAAPAANPAAVAAPKRKKAATK